MPTWYSLNLEQLFAALKTTSQGLLSTEANQRLKKLGYNELKTKGTPLWKKIIEPFTSVFVIVLVVAAAISFLSEDVVEGVVITSIIAINSAIYYIQQHATERALRSLKQYNEQNVRVFRDGQLVDLPSKLLVPGDVILMSEGQRVPADARIINEENLFINEAVLTGESLPIKKTASAIEANKSLHEQNNMVFSGTYVISGNGTAVVINTGARTQLGLITKMVAQVEQKSPMQQKIDSIVSRLIKILTVTAFVIFLLSWLRGMEATEAIRFVLAMMVSAVPEDLPIALTVVAVLGMRRMAKKNALVRSMRTIEDLGLTTVIATDKTGTLTKNNLSVVESWSPDPKINLREVSLKTLGSKLNVVEPFDQALKKFSKPETDHTSQLIKNYPFNQVQRMSGALWNESGKKILYVKGAPEHILNLCKLDANERHLAESMLHAMVSRGLRVIALAKSSLSFEIKDLNEVNSQPLEFIGLIGFADEVRLESASAIAAAKSAGIKVVMLTGDHYETAFQVSQSLGISNHRDQVIMDSELPETEEKIEPLLKIKTVFVRILPQQKFNILQALKRHEITAMTGDGVNDVPALVNAHVGIAMGSGSDIAKDAADMILIDNSFTSIVNAIGEGRIIYDNIRRMLYYLLSSSLGEVITVIVALLIGLPLPVTAIMILWVNLMTNTALVIPLGLEPAEEDYMKRPPRRPQVPILDNVILSRIVLVGIAMAIPILLVFNMLISAGYSLQYAQSVAFVMLVVSQWMNALNARSERFSVIKRLKVINYKLLIGLFIAIILQALVMFGPLKAVFGVADINFNHLLIGILSATTAVFLTSELHKLFYNKDQFSFIKQLKFFKVLGKFKI